MCLDQDKRSRSTFGCVFTKTNGADKILDAFWSWWTFRCFLTNTNGHDRILDAFCAWLTLNINFWIRFDTDQRSRLAFGCFLTIINGQDRLLEAFWPWSMVKINFWILFNRDQWSRTMFGFSMRFDPKQLSRWAFCCLLIKIISEDWILDAFWPWWTIKIDL